MELEFTFEFLSDGLITYGFCDEHAAWLSSCCDWYHFPLWLEEYHLPYHNHEGKHTIRRPIPASVQQILQHFDVLTKVKAHHVSCMQKSAAWNFVFIFMNPGKSNATVCPTQALQSKYCYTLIAMTLRWRMLETSGNYHCCLKIGGAGGRSWMCYWERPLQLNNINCVLRSSNEVLFLSQIDRGIMYAGRMTIKCVTFYTNMSSLKGLQCSSLFTWLLEISA